MTILSIVLIILFFGVLIAVHEFGHFIAAKSLGVRVEEFAIGMGAQAVLQEKGGDHLLPPGPAHRRFLRHGGGGGELRRPPLFQQ